MRLRPGFVRRSVMCLALAVLPAAPAFAQDVSAPAILQWFEASWKTMEKRTPDVFNAGYGSVWTPPPGRALNTAAGGGIGYDVYDRFDLGKARDTTLYGTETGYKTMIRQVQRFGGSVYVDFVHHHVGSFDIAPGNSPGPYVQDRRDYPGFILSNVGQENGDTYKDPPNAPSGHPAYEYQYRLARLLTLSFTQGAGQTQYTRNPVPGGVNNIPQAPNAWAIPTATTNTAGQVVSSGILRRANTPDADNARFYPDRQGPSRIVRDRGVDYTVYDYNLANPLAGDPVQEDVSGIIMRYAQWLTQSVGVDGLRVDAARHVPLGAAGDPWNPTQVDVPKLIDRAVAGSSTRINLDGTRRSVFQFQEVFNGDPNFLQGFVRRSAQAGDTTQPNRDVLDFPMWFAMRSNLTDNGGNNNWYNVRNASQDNRDDGLAHNGSQSIGFVVNHDEGGVHLSNVAHAWILTRPGNAYVYFRGAEFDRTGNNSFFLKDGRGDSLGGLYGNLVTRLVEIRNSYGRGNFSERWIDGGGFSNIYAYERSGSMIVGLSSFTAGQGITSFDERGQMYVNFQPGQRLIELTGNADDVVVDPGNQIPSVITVGSTDNAGLGSGRVTLRIPRNQNINGVNHGRGYVMYGLPRPTGTLTLSNITQTFGPETPTNNQTNTTARLTSFDVITANSFTVSLATNVVVVDGWTDHRAAGDNALLKINDGFDANGNGSADFPSSAPSNALSYGFEQFLTSRTPGFVSSTSSQPGLYTQVVNAAALPEGMNYLTVRAFRQQGPGESAIYSDFRRVFYVDRLKPVSAVASFNASSLAGAGGRDLQVRSTDLTADSVHVLYNLPASLTESEVLAMVATTNKAEQVDRDLFSSLVGSVPSGNHVVTVVTYEITGNFNVQRFTGVSVTNGLGAGLGDLDFDGILEPSDILSFETAFLSNNTVFNPAADVNGNGIIDTTDLRALEFQLRSKNAPQATMDAYYAFFGRTLYIPEPAALGLLAPATLLLGRRQRRA